MTVSSQIIEVLDNIFEKFGIAIDWTAANVLPYLEQLAGKYIDWEIATSKMWIWVGAIAIVFGIITILLDVICSWGGLGYCFGSVILLAGAIVVGAQVLDILTCQHFPEKMILEYVQQLMATS